MFKLSRTGVPAMQSNAVPGQGTEWPIRFLFGLPLAAAITLGLFLLMRAMTAVEQIEVSKKSDDWNPLINPVIEEMEIRDRDTLFEPSEIVTPPPDIPQIEQQNPILPGEPISQAIGSIPDMGEADLKNSIFSLEMTDRGVQPIIRVPPVYPPRMASAGIEGQCKITLDVSAEGMPMNILAQCTSRGFEKSTIRAVGKWRYSPKIMEGQAVIRRGVRTTLSYHLND